MAYQPEFVNTLWFRVLNHIIDVVFLTDIIITFRTSFIDSYGNEIIDARDIAKQYLTGQFTLDLFATVPID